MPVNREINNMRKRLAPLLVSVITLILAINPIGLSQDGKFLQVQNKALEQIPSDNRARLIERLELYIRSLIRGELGDAYELMPDGCKHGLRKEEWLKEASYKPPGPLQRFILKDAYTGDYDSPEILPAEKWIIRGCGIYKVGGEPVSYAVSYSTMLMNGEWYICWSGIATEGKADNYIRCSE
jgi:hypothetical protein